MNERIRELAEQASFRQFIMPKSNSLSSLDNCNGAFTEQDAIEKFAELIVRECMGLVEGFESTQEVALDEYVDYEASAVLKEHFGVEE